jgi:septum formation protein
MSEVILASTSRYRRELIGRLGLTVTCMASPFDEEAVKEGLSALSIAERARALAIGKAEALGERFPDAVIIGSDQMGELDGEALGKPHTAENARAQLRRLAGREHRLHTAVALHHRASGRTEALVDTHALVMRALTDEAIADYVARDAPLDCAGSYRVESLGIALFERVRGDDFTAVIGLPLTRVVGLLEGFGVRVLG